MFTSEFINNNVWYLWVMIPTFMILTIVVSARFGWSALGSVLIGINPLSMLVFFLIAVAPLVVISVSCSTMFIWFCALQAGKLIVDK